MGASIMAMVPRSPATFVRSRNHFQVLGDPAGRASSRRASLYRVRARELADRAKGARDESDRRYLLDQAEIYRRVADALAPLPPSVPANACRARRDARLHRR
ncbi:MAG: hypothetical protein WBE29_00395, partial [Pseudolabrys sp.]